MPSGKRAKQQRREAAAGGKTPPPVRSKGGGLGGPRQASPRALAIGGGVVVVVIVAIVLAVVLGKSHSPSNPSADGPAVHIVAGTPAKGSATGPTALPGARDVATMFKGVPQNHFILGSANAPVVLTEFIDLQCPYCQQFETQDLPTLVSKFVRTGKLRIKIEPWSILDRTATEYDSDRGQKATIAAAAQNKAFDFAEVLYDNQPPNSEGTGWMNDAIISQVAASVNGLDTQQFGADVNSAATKTLVQAVDSLASRLSSANQNFNGTPGLFLSKGNGPLQLFGTGPPDLASLESAINALAK
jgi:protein-disulfide isomerase